MMNGDFLVGAFRGTKLIQRRGQVGGARSVFVPLQGMKNHLTYPSLGGEIKNPFKGAAKLFAGDLVEYRTDSNGVKPEIYVLKTYLVESVSSNKKIVNIVKDDYKHIPFVGDKIAPAPNTMDGTITGLTVTSVTVTKVGTVDVWALGLSGEITASKGTILVEADSAGTGMMVKDINGVLDCDLDMYDTPATGSSDFDGARYFYTPALGGVMYINKMSPLPACVKAKNKININGWFQVGTL